MARLVVLRFEDDEEADQFVEAPRVLASMLVMKTATVEMMVQTPTKFCDCSFRGDGWARYGDHDWWLHPACGKPAVGWANNPRAVVFESVDLLERQSANTRDRVESVRSRIVDDSEDDGLGSGEYPVLYRGDVAVRDD